MELEDEQSFGRFRFGPCLHGVGIGVIRTPAGEAAGRAPGLRSRRRARSNCSPSGVEAPPVDLAVGGRRASRIPCRLTGSRTTRWPRLDEVALRAVTRPTLHRGERNPVLAALAAKDAQRRPFSVGAPDVCARRGRVMVVIGTVAEDQGSHRLGCAPSERLPMSMSRTERLRHMHERRLLWKPVPHCDTCGRALTGGERHGYSTVRALPHRRRRRGGRHTGLGGRRLPRASLDPDLLVEQTRRPVDRGRAAPGRHGGDPRRVQLGAWPARLVGAPAHAGVRRRRRGVRAGVVGHRRSRARRARRRGHDRSCRRRPHRPHADRDGGLSVKRVSTSRRACPRASARRPRRRPRASAGPPWPASASSTSAAVAGIVWIVLRPSVADAGVGRGVVRRVRTVDHRRLPPSLRAPHVPPRRRVRWALLAFGAATFQNSALSWSADHRAHHADTDGDRRPAPDHPWRLVRPHRLAVPST